jgi:hypothetical protein
MTGGLKIILISTLDNIPFQYFFRFDENRLIFIDQHKYLLFLLEFPFLSKIGKIEKVKLEVIP